MTDLTVREILDAFTRALDETRWKIERGEMPDGRLDWPGYAVAQEKVTHMEERPAISDMTPRQILDAVSRALDRVAARFAEQKTDQTSGRPPRQPIE